MDLRQTIANESGSKVHPKMISSLVSAVLEWLLIFMLFVDACFSYWVTKFARFGQLQVPCLLCSRLDHVLGRQSDGFYWQLFCHKHKLDISSLFFCRLHNNLVDGRGTCESCFSSSATVNMSNAEVYRLGGDKLGDGNPCYDPSQGASPKEDNIAVAKNCVCCNEQWIPRTCSQNLSCINSEREEVNALSSLTSKSNVDEEHEAMAGSSQRDQARNGDPFSEDESANAHFHVMETLIQDTAAKRVSTEPKMVTVAGSLAQEQLIHPASPTKSSNFACNTESKERTWQPADCNNTVIGTSNLQPFPEAPASPSIKQTDCEEPKDIDVSSATEFEKDVHVECSEVSNLESGLAAAIELRKEVTTVCGESSKAGRDCIPENEIQIDLKPCKHDAGTQMSESLDLGDAYKLAVGARGRQLSGRLLEQQRSMTESTRASEDLMLLLSHISAARGTDLPLYDVSPRVSATSEDFKAVDVCSITGMQILQRRISLERNESNLSFDGSVVSEIDGESVADRLKRQVEYDKKIMAALYKELEEERNASAIAANQAMAMITRLQEEKAALNMEALQCLRMMEEQAEYDGDALQNAQELLVEKESQIQNFENELRVYKNEFGDLSLSNNVVKASTESDEGKLEAEVETNYAKSNATTFNISSKDKHDVIGNADGEPKMLDGYAGAGRISLPQFEDEKQFIIQYLRKLEEKLIIFSGHEVYPDMADCRFSAGEGLELNSSKLCSAGVSCRQDAVEENHRPEDVFMNREASFEDLSRETNSQHVIAGHDEFTSEWHADRDAELDAFRRELSSMNNRIKALETEQNIVECSINSLGKGSEGFEFIQEIAVRIQELHSTYIRRNEDLS